jgi:exonuclease VII large subunit
MANSIISLLAMKYTFNADEALAYYNDHKDDVGSATSISTVQRAENAITKTKAEIEELKSKIPSKKGKMLEKANEKLLKLEEKLSEQMERLEKKKAKQATVEPKKEEVSTPKKQKKEKVEAPAAPKKAPKSDDEKRIKRMSPTMTKQLTKVFEETSELEFKKEYSQNFAKYVNELTKEDFEAKNLSDHMRDYVASTAPSPAVSREVAADFEVKEPEEIPDEDMCEVTFNKVKYVVGETSKRVYEADEENGDRFVGFVGIGKFLKMTIPK